MPNSPTFEEAFAVASEADLNRALKFFEQNKDAAKSANQVLDVEGHAVQPIRPPLHHLGPGQQPLGRIVGAANRVFLDGRKLALDPVGGEPGLVQDRRGHATDAVMRDLRLVVTQAPQRRVDRVLAG